MLYTHSLVLWLFEYWLYVPQIPFRCKILYVILDFKRFENRNLVLCTFSELMNWVHCCQETSSFLNKINVSKCQIIVNAITTFIERKNYF